MWRWSRSIRWRSSAAFALVAATVSAVLGTVVFDITARTRMDDVRGEVADRARSAAQLWMSDRSLAASATINDPAVPVAARIRASEDEVVTFLKPFSGPGIAWGLAPVRDSGTRGTLAVQASFASVRSELESLRRTLALGGVVATLVGGALGLVLAGGLSKRLRQAAQAAGRIEAGDPHARIDWQGHDEGARLAGAVDRMADALRARVEREQRFTADVAHELRTPATGLLSVAELLPADWRGEAVRDRARRLATLVEELLEIARLESGHEEASRRWVPLERFLADTASGYSVELDDCPDMELFTDPRRVARILTNLFDNAFKHGRAPVHVRLDGSRVVVSDTGPGFPLDLIDRVADRFVTASSHRGDGFGLGLAIAACHADLLGARLELRNHDGGGASAALVLPADCIRERDQG
jgi:signal transduction histidine kinase